ncbi:MAG: CinA family nicotinamide mononucleotide deamidase-related protein [Sphingobacteriales bacterium]|nr:MAG: CinA family nicotinamide mononucleotide deamidase-related protein [Sphingobacteriales bacterium]
MIIEKKMKAAILIIGDEILGGSTLDTNSHFAAGLLRAHNFELQNILTVADKADSIKTGLDILFSFADIVISTGGLGPTKDDITKHVITEYFGTQLVFNEDVYENLSQRFAKRGLKVNELTKTQAFVPESAEIIQNPVGTAPVFWMENKNNGKVLITLPGVPGETRFLLEGAILPRLKSRFQTGHVVQRSIHTVGIAESSLAMKLEEVDEKIEAANNPNEFYKLAYLPTLNQVKLQITGIGNDEIQIRNQIDVFLEEIEKRAHEYIFGYDQDVFAAHIGQILLDRKATLSTAESCTGGYLAHQITSVTGSANYYHGTIVSYDNEVKMKQLGVKKETLDKYGAVSEETCKEMLEGALKAFGTTYAIATTGIAGPTGDVEGKPIGTIWIGVASEYKMVTKRFQFDRNRLENIHLFAITSLDLLRRFVLGYKI